MCMCGDSECPSCGVAQGTKAAVKKAYIVYDSPDSALVEELLEALKGLVEAYAAINERPQYTREYAYALAAIDKAEGRS